MEKNIFYLNIDGKKYWIDSSWSIQEITDPTTIYPIICAELSSKTMDELAALVDEFAISKRSTNVAAITLVPKWEEANIQVEIDEEYAKNKHSRNLSTTTFANPSNYVLNSSVVTPVSGKSIMAYYYGDSENNLQILH